MSAKLRIAVVMGGQSSEREVSLVTGRGVLAALERLGYEIHALDFDEHFVDRVRTIAPALVFNALHGAGGEDGTIQGVLDWLGIPYTGSGLRASALALDKHLTKKLLSAEGMVTPAWDLFQFGGGTLPLLPGSLSLPMVIKPRNEGSSTGVVIVRTHEEWSQAMIAAAKQGNDVLAEEFVAGREFTCAVLGEEALPVIEIISNRGEFYNYDAKYDSGGCTHIVPAQIDADLTRRLQVLALSVHRLLGLRDYSRADFIVSAEGRPSILEINSLPGMTPTSLVPDACKAVGIGYDALVDRLVCFASERGGIAEIVYSE
ncbi:MAG TPA: D-alanine--D-alanine ligase [Candidatus Baltobacteraceae bacterium]|jgi:D-alanine-D-alanine ligase|nr:D-alanine--D-alanine ligase [Candidatus Baltobacteraceae bacterium]